MPKTELRPAYAWDCDNCGIENFCRGIIPEMSQEDLNQLREEHGVQPWETGGFVMAPTTVTCKSCGSDYITTHYSDEEQ